MQNKLKIAVIGGSGKSGKYLIQELLKTDFNLKVLVRNKENFKIRNSRIEIIYGDVRDYETVQSLIIDSDVVISTLGGTPLSEPTVFSQATKNTIKAMTKFNISRYIVVTGLNVNTPKDKKGTATQAGTDWMLANFPKSTKDRQHEYDLLVESKIDWTMVRLPLIIQTDDRLETKVSFLDCFGNSISATDLANFLIELIADKTYFKEAPFISNI